VWSAVDVDSKELLALEASYGRSCLNALSFLKKALRMCTNKPLVLVDKGPWYRWAFERLGLEYRHEEQGREILQIPEGENRSTLLIHFVLVVVGFIFVVFMTVGDAV
jgi:transposase-like protein